MSQREQVSAKREFWLYLVSPLDKNRSWARDIAQLVEHLPSRHQVLGSLPSTAEARMIPTSRLDRLHETASKRKEKKKI